jgi:RNA recognition motif-containing protein
MSSAGKVVKAKILVDREGRNKGCALVEFSTVVEAVRAITRFHQSTYRVSIFSFIH